MDLLTSVMNLIIPPFILILLITVQPFYLTHKFVCFVIQIFSVEDMIGKVVVITGASSGIGEQLAYEYAKRGARLVLVARRESRLQVVAENARRLGSPKVFIVCADVSVMDECKRFINETISHFGRLDHLVNNAGITSTYYFDKTTNITVPRSLFDINFWGSIYPTHFAIPHLKKSKGRIIVNTSTAAWIYGPSISIYGASKGALVNFYETLRVELSSKIKITLLSPGLIASEMSDGKVLSKDGKVEVNRKMMEELVGIIPIRDTADSAKVFVDGICRGKRWVTDPSWFSALKLFQIFVPEVIEWVLRLHTSRSRTEKSS